MISLAAGMEKLYAQPGQSFSIMAIIAIRKLDESLGIQGMAVDHFANFTWEGEEAVLTRLRVDQWCRFRALPSFPRQCPLGGQLAIVISAFAGVCFTNSDMGQADKEK